MLKKANRGIIFKGQTRKKIADILLEINDAKEIDRLIMLMNILKIMAQSSDYEVLSSMVYSSHFQKKDFDKINNIYQYILDHFKNKITLTDISAISNMSPNAFCRYFKSRTGKTFVHFVNEVRIGYAGKLLIENKMNISQVCYEVGFENFSNFSRQFRKIHGMTPKEYREVIIKKQPA
jgi:AraC-like DNA-binding protein